VPAVCLAATKLPTAIFSHLLFYSYFQRRSLKFMASRGSKSHV
jgi:hypothetical protein